MKFQFIISLLPYELNSIPMFFKKNGSYLRDKGYFWPNRYLVGSKNMKNHNWLLYNENLNNGVAEEFISKCIEMNSMGVSTFIFIDWSSMDIEPLVFIERLVFLISKIENNYQLNLIHFNFKTQNFLKSNNYNIFNINEIYDISKLKFKDLHNNFNICLSDSENMKSFVNTIVDFSSQEDFYCALKDDHDLAVILNTKKYNDLLIYLIHKSQYSNYKINIDSIKDLMNKGLFSDYNIFFQTNRFKNKAKILPWGKGNEEKIKEFFVFWAIFNLISE